MNPAVWRRDRALGERLLHLDPAQGSIADRAVADLPALLHPGDLLVVNDAATLPASLPGTCRAGPIEARLAAAGEEPARWTAVLFGPGTWRQRTEDRPPPPALSPGDSIDFAGGLRAKITSVSPLSPRLVHLWFDAEPARLWPALYRAGRPVQYSYLAGPLRLWHVQTAYGARPWAVEMPSAGRPLGVSLLLEARRRGVRLAAVTHAAGLSSTGDPRLDQALPLPERYDIPEATVRAVEEAKAAGGRVVAAGTSVVRALEGAARESGGPLRAGVGVTDLRLSAASQLAQVDGLFTGLHEPGSSHFELASAFAPEVLLEKGFRHAEAAGYLGHEFGDSMLVLTARGVVRTGGVLESI